MKEQVDAAMERYREALGKAEDADAKLRERPVMNFRKIMNAKHRFASRIEHLKKTIEHCVSVVAICKIGGQENARASYESRLKELNEELAELLKQNGEEK